MTGRAKRLLAGGLVVLGLAAAGALVAVRVREDRAAAAAAAAPAAAAPSPPSTTDEIEPNDAPVSAQLIGPLPAEIHGHLTAEDRDYYRLVTDEPGGHVLDAWIEDLPGAQLAALDDSGAVRGSAIAPGRIGALGLVRGSTLLVVTGPAGAYRLFVRRSPWTDGMDWEPDDDPGHAQSMSRVDKTASELAHFRARGSWSKPGDVDCFLVPLVVPPSGAVLRMELTPPAGVQPRLLVLDGGDPSAKIPRRLLTEVIASAPGEKVILPALGARSWEKSYVACSRVEAGNAFGERYVLDVHSFTPDGPFEFEPNETPETASALPRDLTVSGYLTDGDTDWYRISAGPKLELRAELVLPEGVAATVALLDEQRRELAHAQGTGRVGVTALAPAFVEIKPVNRGSVAAQYRLSVRAAGRAP